MQKKLVKNVIVDVGYVGLKGTRLTEGFDGNRTIQVLVPGPSTPSSVRGVRTRATTPSRSTRASATPPITPCRPSSSGVWEPGFRCWAPTPSRKLSATPTSAAWAAAPTSAAPRITSMRRPTRPLRLRIRHRLGGGHLRPTVLQELVASAPDGPGRLAAWHYPHRADRFRLGDGRVGRRLTGTGLGSRYSIVSGQSVNVSDPNRDMWFNTAAFMNAPAGGGGTLDAFDYVDIFETDTLIASLSTQIGIADCAPRRNTAEQIQQKTGWELIGLEQRSERAGSVAAQVPDFARSLSVAPMGSKGECRV